MTASKVSSGASRLGGLIRGASGVLTGGLVVLALAVLAASVLASEKNVAGPALSMVIIHLVVAAVAVVVQVAGDRRGLAGAVCSAALVATLCGALLWLQWWA